MEKIRENRRDCVMFVFLFKNFREGKKCERYNV